MAVWCNVGKINLDTITIRRVRYVEDLCVERGKRDSGRCLPLSFQVESIGSIWSIIRE